jgi:hypothetical protein
MLADRLAVPAHRTGRRLGLVAAMVWAVAAAAPAIAAVPATLQLEGVLTTTGGGAVVDGPYKLTFALWDAETAGTKLWSDTADVTIAGGRFIATAGAGTPIDAKALAAGKVWLGLAVGAEPELPRKQIAATPFAMRAALAEAVECSGCVSAAAAAFNYAGAATKGGPAADLDCTGCVSVAELKFDGDVDLGGNSIKAANATFSGDVAAKTVTATSFAGDGSKLTGINLPKGACKAGEAVIGIASDGSLQCKAFSAALPADGLSAVSNGLLVNQYVESVAIADKLGIPDNTGADANVKVDVPNWGTVQSLKVHVVVENTDLSTLRLRLLPPDDKKVGYTLCDPCGAKDAKAFDKEFTDAAKLQVGDLAAWLGKSPEGSWNLVASDTSYCVKQAPGNATLCDFDNKLDGAITAFSVQAKVISAQKVSATALFKPEGGLQLAVAAKEPVACDAGHLGYVYINTATNALTICNGSKWFAMSIDTTFGSPSNPALHCKDLVAKQPGTESGVYWIDPDGQGGLGAFQVFCDMKTSGGGWTLVASTMIPYSGNGGGDTVWKIGTPHPGLQTTKATTSTVSLVNTIPFNTLTDFRFSCYTDASASTYGVDWMFPLSNSGNATLLSDIYDDAKIGVYANGKLTQSTGTQRLIGYDNSGSKADWGLGSNAGDSNYWTHESWGQVDAQGGHCQEVGVAHSSATLAGKGIYHIWVR